VPVFSVSIYPRFHGLDGCRQTNNGRSPFARHFSEKACNWSSGLAGGAAFLRTLSLTASIEEKIQL
jgi:hypothetical protein